jgi:predicted NAD/FAD-binding protein
MHALRTKAGVRNSRIVTLNRSTVFRTVPNVLNVLYTQNRRFDQVVIGALRYQVLAVMSLASTVSIASTISNSRHEEFGLCDRASGGTTSKADGSAHG